MATLNENIPGFEALVRKEFLYDLQRGHGEYVKCYVFGVASIAGRALGFHVMTDAGACFWRLPIHALCWDECDPVDLSDVELWDCLSDEVTVTVFDFLEGKCGRVLLAGEPHACQYMLTVDWYASSMADQAGVMGHKCGHLLKLEDGYFALQPNNRILWADGAFVPRPFQRPDYKITTREWRAESEPFATSDSDEMFYDVKQQGNGRA